MASQDVTVNKCSVDQLQSLSLMFPDPQRSLDNMKRTYYTLLSVTKKTVQKIYIQDLIRHGFQTKNTQFVLKRLVRCSKSETFRSAENVKVVNRTLMLMVLMDATEDLRETYRLAGKRIKSLFKFAKNRLGTGPSKLFKDSFFDIVRKSRESVWSKERKREKGNLI